MTRAEIDPTSPKEGTVPRRVWFTGYCPHCGKDFRSPTARNVHLQLDAKYTGFRPQFPCLICTNERAIFDTQPQLTKHVDQIHAPQEKKYCPFPRCTKSYLQNQSLTLHIRDIHTFNSPQCRYCLEKFKTTSTMLQHRRKTHGLINRATLLLPLASSIRKMIPSLPITGRPILSTPQYFRCHHCNAKHSTKKESIMHRITCGPQTK
jgi:hypothetical protein